MAYLLRSIELFNPTHGAVAIVPESLMYSETDEFSRKLLSESFSIQRIADLHSCTFRGARANAIAVQILPSDKPVVTRQFTSLRKPLRIRLTRGGLPVHIMKRSLRGIPFVHSTEIRKILNGASKSDFLLTEDCLKGRIVGWAILIPRVGVAEKDLVQAVNIRLPIQLSDCVIALECKNKLVAQELGARIHESWDDFRDLCKGTGARYVTMSRLSAWLNFKNVDIEIG